MAQVRRRKGTVAPLRPMDLSRSCVSLSTPASPGLSFSPGTEDCSEDSAGATPVHDLYQLLRIAAANGPVALEIPATLVVGKAGRDVLFFNDDKKLVKLYEAKDVLSQFFAQGLQRTAEDPSEAPLAFFRSQSTGFKVLFTVEDAEMLWKGTRDATKMMQKYILSSSGETSKVRIVWRRSGDPKRFKMHKRHTDFPRTGRRLPRSSSYNALKSAFKYDLNAFQHAGQLKKSSFSPYYPFPSVLCDETRQKLTSSKTALFSPRPNPQCDFSSLASDYLIEPIVGNLPKAERMGQTIVEVLQHFVLREMEEIEELAYDVIQAEGGNCYLLNAKWMKVGRREAVESSLDVLETVPEGGEKLQEMRLKQKFTDLMRSIAPESPCQKAPFIDLKDIKQENQRAYLTHHLHTWPLDSPPDSSTPDPLLSHLRSNLDQAESRLNDLMTAATLHRARAKEAENISLEKYSSEMLHQVLTKVYDRVRADLVLCKHFHGKSRGEISMIKSGFMKAFSGVDNVYFKRNVKRAHEGMGISTTAFAQFVQIFLAVMREEGIQASDIAIVHKHLQSFTEDIVEDEDEALHC